jgi:hypothetical protein
MFLEESRRFEEIHFEDQQIGAQPPIFPSLFFGAQ